MAISKLALKKHLIGRANIENVGVYEWLNWLSEMLSGQDFRGLFGPRRFSDETSFHAVAEAEGLGLMF